MTITLPNMEGKNGQTGTGTENEKYEENYFEVQKESLLSYFSGLI